MIAKLGRRGILSYYFFSPKLGRGDTWNWLGISIANQGRTYILNCGRKVFAIAGCSDILNSTKVSESDHKNRNCNCVIVVKFAT